MKKFWWLQPVYVGVLFITFVRAGSLVAEEDTEEDYVSLKQRECDEYHGELEGIDEGTYESISEEEIDINKDLSYKKAIKSVLCWTQIVTTTLNSYGQVTNKTSKYGLSVETSNVLVGTHIKYPPHFQNNLAARSNHPVVIYKKHDKTVREERYVTCKHTYKVFEKDGKVGKQKLEVWIRPKNSNQVILNPLEVSSKSTEDCTDVKVSTNESTPDDIPTGRVTTKDYTDISEEITTTSSTTESTVNVTELPYGVTSSLESEEADSCEDEASFEFDEIENEFFPTLVPSDDDTFPIKIVKGNLPMPIETTCENINKNILAVLCPALPYKLPIINDTLIPHDAKLTFSAVVPSPIGGNFVLVKGKRSCYILQRHNKITCPLDSRNLLTLLIYHKEKPATVIHSTVTEVTKAVETETPIIASKLTTPYSYDTTISSISTPLTKEVTDTPSTQTITETELKITSTTTSHLINTSPTLTLKIIDLNKYAEPICINADKMVKQGDCPKSTYELHMLTLKIPGDMKVFNATLIPENLNEYIFVKGKFDCYYFKKIAYVKCSKYRTNVINVLKVHIQNETSAKTTVGVPEVTPVITAETNPTETVFNVESTTITIPSTTNIKITETTTSQKTEEEYISESTATGNKIKLTTVSLPLVIYNPIVMMIDYCENLTVINCMEITNNISVVKCPSSTELIYQVDESTLPINRVWNYFTETFSNKNPLLVLGKGEQNCYLFEKLINISCNSNKKNQIILHKVHTNFNKGVCKATTEQAYVPNLTTVFYPSTEETETTTVSTTTEGNSVTPVYQNIETVSITYSPQPTTDPDKILHPSINNLILHLTDIYYNETTTKCAEINNNIRLVECPINRKQIYYFDDSTIPINYTLTYIDDISQYWKYQYIIAQGGKNCYLFETIANVYCSKNKKSHINLYRMHTLNHILVDKEKPYSSTSKEENSEGDRTETTPKSTVITTTTDKQNGITDTKTTTLDTNMKIFGNATKPRTVIIKLIDNEPSGNTKVKCKRVSKYVTSVKCPKQTNEMYTFTRFAIPKAIKIFRSKSIPSSLKYKFISTKGLYSCYIFKEIENTICPSNRGIAVILHRDHMPPETTTLSNLYEIITSYLNEKPSKSESENLDNTDTTPASIHIDQMTENIASSTLPPLVYTESRIESTSESEAQSESKLTRTTRSTVSYEEEFQKEPSTETLYTVVEEENLPKTTYATTVNPYQERETIIISSAETKSTIIPLVSETKTNKITKLPSEVTTFSTPEKASPYFQSHEIIKTIPFGNKYTTEPVEANLGKTKLSEVTAKVTSTGNLHLTTFTLSPELATETIKATEKSSFYTGNNFIVKLIDVQNAKEDIVKCKKVHKYVLVVPCPKNANVLYNFDALEMPAIARPVKFEKVPELFKQRAIYARGSFACYAFIALIGTTCPDSEHNVLEMVRIHKREPQSSLLSTQLPVAPSKETIATVTTYPKIPYVTNSHLQRGEVLVPIDFVKETVTEKPIYIEPEVLIPAHRPNISTHKSSSTTTPYLFTKGTTSMPVDTRISVEEVTEIDEDKSTVSDSAIKGNITLNTTRRSPVTDFIPGEKSSDSFFIESTETTTEDESKGLSHDTYDDIIARLIHVDSSKRKTVKCKIVSRYIIRLKCPSQMKKAYFLNEYYIPRSTKIIHLRYNPNNWRQKYILAKGLMGCYTLADMGDTKCPHNTKNTVNLLKFNYVISPKVSVKTNFTKPVSNVTPLTLFTESLVKTKDEDISATTNLGTTHYTPETNLGTTQYIDAIKPKVKFTLKPWITGEDTYSTTNVGTTTFGNEVKPKIYLPVTPWLTGGNAYNTNNLDTTKYGHEIKPEVSVPVSPWITGGDVHTTTNLGTTKYGHEIKPEVSVPVRPWITVGDVYRTTNVGTTKYGHEMKPEVNVPVIPWTRGDGSTSNLSTHPYEHEVKSKVKFTVVPWITDEKISTSSFEITNYPYKIKPIVTVTGGVTHLKGEEYTTKIPTAHITTTHFKEKISSDSNLVTKLPSTETTSKHTKYHYTNMKPKTKEGLWTEGTVITSTYNDTKHPITSSGLKIFPAITSSGSDITKSSTISNQSTLKTTEAPASTTHKTTVDSGQVSTINISKVAPTGSIEFTKKGSYIHDSSFLARLVNINNFEKVNVKCQKMYNQVISVKCPLNTKGYYYVNETLISNFAEINKFEKFPKSLLDIHSVVFAKGKTDCYIFKTLGNTRCPQTIDNMLNMFKLYNNTTHKSKTTITSPTTSKPSATSSTLHKNQSASIKTESSIINGFTTAYFETPKLDYTGTAQFQNVTVQPNVTITNYVTHTIHSSTTTSDTGKTISSTTSESIITKTPTATETTATANIETLYVNSTEPATHHITTTKNIGSTVQLPDDDRLFTVRLINFQKIGIKYTCKKIYRNIINVNCPKNSKDLYVIHKFHLPDNVNKIYFNNIQKLLQYKFIVARRIYKCYLLIDLGDTECPENADLLNLYKEYDYSRPNLPDLREKLLLANPQVTYGTVEPEVEYNVTHNQFKTTAVNPSIPTMGTGDTTNLVKVTEYNITKTTSTFPEDYSSTLSEINTIIQEMGNEVSTTNYFQGTTKYDIISSGYGSTDKTKKADRTEGAKNIDLYTTLPIDIYTIEHSYGNSTVPAPVTYVLYHNFTESKQTIQTALPTQVTQSMPDEEHNCSNSFIVDLVDLYNPERAESIYKYVSSNVMRINCSGLANTAYKVNESEIPNNARIIPLTDYQELTITNFIYARGIFGCYAFAELANIDCPDSLNNVLTMHKTVISNNKEYVSFPTTLTTAIPLITGSQTSSEEEPPTTTTEKPIQSQKKYRIAKLIDVDPTKYLKVTCIKVFRHVISTKCPSNTDVLYKVRESQFQHNDKLLNLKSLPKSLTKKFIFAKGRSDCHLFKKKYAVKCPKSTENVIPMYRISAFTTAKTKPVPKPTKDSISISSFPPMSSLESWEDTAGDFISAEDGKQFHNLKTTIKPTQPEQEKTGIDTKIVTIPPTETTTNGFTIYTQKTNPFVTLLNHTETTTTTTSVEGKDETSAETQKPIIVKYVSHGREHCYVINAAIKIKHVKCPHDTSRIPRIVNPRLIKMICRRKIQKYHNKLHMEELLRKYNLLKFAEKK